MDSIKLNFQRFEFKYYLKPETASQIEKELIRNNMEYDPYVFNSPLKEYTVASLYFDSPSLSCYHEKVSGLKKRFKLRLRIYKDFVEEGDSVFLEIKKKDDMVVFKDRAVLPFLIYQKLFKKGGNDISFLNSLNLNSGDKRVIEEFLFKKLDYCMSPIIYVRYKRKPLVGKFNKNLRVTFDSQIKATYSNNIESCENLHEILPEHLVMEVKYDNTLPNWFLQIIRKYQLDRLSFSKYCGGVLTSKKNHQF